VRQLRFHSECFVTRLHRVDGQQWWVADAVNADEHLQAVGVPVTDHPGDRDAFPH
jgi:hypothetical protein